MRNIIVALLNIAGVGMLLAAGLVAWNIYNPALPAVPLDVTIVDEHSPTVQPPQRLIPAVTVTPTAPSAAVVPSFLPESKPSEKAQDDAPSIAERKINLSQLEAERAKAFPPPAHSLPTRLVLPAINVDSPIIEVGWKTSEQNGLLVSEWEVADYAVGFLKLSALPGAPGNTVMAGHNNINGEVFKNLIDLKLGDEVFVFVDQTAYRYVVKQKLLLKEAGMPIEQRLQNAQWIAPTDDTRLTLVSCWPYTSNTHRVIVVATPADN